MTAPAPLVLGHSARVPLLGAELVANRLRARPGLRLILPTGHTPLGMYDALRAHAADGSLPTEQATLFQLDEYAGLEPGDDRSYSAYLRRELRGIRFKTFHELEATEAACARHQALLDEAPIDLVVLGLGRDGHVAFDEPGSSIDAGVRRVELHPQTRADAAADFGGIDRVPTHAVTVGLRTLLAARELIVLVTGDAKAEALRGMLESDPTADCPASLLRDHPRISVICDSDAAALLTPAPGATSHRAVVVLGHREPEVSAPDDVSEESRVRLRRALRECREHPPRVAIFTGYTRTPEGLSEAEQMKSDWPLPEVPTLLEDAGRNTAENASRSLPLIRAIGEVSSVTVVTSAWHIRAAWFFAPYRTLGLRLRFAPAFHRPWLRQLLSELRALPSARGQRRRAMAEMRLPAETELRS
ncbi:MAG TPA: 6-phosphogluconolactonase [Thermoleophilaceae bacterium]